MLPNVQYLLPPNLDPPRYSAAVKLVTAAKHIKLMCRMGISSLCASNLIELTSLEPKKNLWIG